MSPIDPYFNPDDFPETGITLLLSCNSERVEEGTVEFLNIHEDFQGRDVVTFICPSCGKTHESLRFG